MSCSGLWDFSSSRSVQNNVVVPKNSLKKVLILVPFGRVALVHWPQRVKSPLDTNYHSLPRLLHLPKAGTRLESENNTTLNLGKPVAFFLEGSVALNFHC